MIFYSSPCIKYKVLPLYLNLLHEAIFNYNCLPKSHKKSPTTNEISLDYFTIFQNQTVKNSSWFIIFEIYHSYLYILHTEADSNILTAGLVLRRKFSLLHRPLPNLYGITVEFSMSQEIALTRGLKYPWCSFLRCDVLIRENGRPQLSQKKVLQCIFYMTESSFCLKISALVLIIFTLLCWFFDIRLLKKYCINF